MKKIYFVALLLMVALTVFGGKKEITNVGLTFSPSNLTIEPGDNVTFVLEAMHTAVEVTHSTWNANGTAPLAGGFSVPFGGGEVTPAKLTAGTHWYVCTTHVASGMKGIIIVGTPTGIDETLGNIDISIFPNPANTLFTIKANSALIGSQYFLTDQTGKQILKGKLVKENTMVDISRLKSGMYLIQIGEQKRRSFKVMKY